MSQTQRTERVEREDRGAVRRPAIFVIEVEPPSTLETYRRLAEMPGVRLLCIEEPPMK